MRWRFDKREATAEQALLKGNGSRIELLCYHTPVDRAVISSTPADTGSVRVGVYVEDARRLSPKRAYMG